ncbi:phosphonate metabolism protein/1,5-bisphosphokinase (PRPP-forming) PhnN [Paracoccus aerodenitrificans]|uniref:phosphonate metabolism protein/1,5-bisphosphokinase (PRPP-forming) PhnN n=1 Tax=Paracoccus aerodenitrificans TaxID=3017781 RepID=UPI0022F0EBF0|nr:phosphonate metabolism protein/1,5-bisphosphokinase (PRPP-forming) PhnN [Paracoccus aerodenitrificans]WBU64385.1 phosphonate metabolism protein/1,5-bisphosphokinase (PRPP-forming) PhnN [Paracoccus aerodenitrificans]
MSANYIAVVGPSGAGKDTLMRKAAEALPDIELVRRVITRPAGDGSEDFEAVAETEFAARQEQEAFILDWQAHGLRYGIPRPARQGTHLVNLSRRILRQAAMALPGLSVIHVTATADVLATRLAERGRETAKEIAARIAREAEFDPAGLQVVTVDNSGELDDAASAFIAAVKELIS